MLINDASITGSLIVNASASLQNISLGGNIIPDETNLRNLGSTDKYFKEIYVSTGSINFVDDGSVVAVLSAGTITAIQSNTSSANSRLAAIENFTSSLNTTYTTDAELNASSSTLTSNINTKLNSSSFNSFTSSATARVNSIEATTASVNTILAGINVKTGSYATTGSNSFNGNQTITGSLIVSCIATISSSYVGNNSSMTLNSGSNFYIQNGGTAEISGSLKISGSLNLLGTTNLATTGSNTFYGTQIISGTTWIAGDFIVQGSSSIQNITGSSINIGTNIINVNTANPAVRYAGLSVQDSGSANGVTGSLLWDSSCNRWIYSNPSTIGYSGGMLLSGPRAATLGTETTLTCNYIAKSGGGDHLYDSCIYENGGCVGINCATPSYNLDVNGTLNVATSTGSQIRLISYGGSSAKILGTQATLGIEACGALTLETNGANERLRIESSGVASFSCQVCVPYLSVKNSDNSILARFGGTGDYVIFAAGANAPDYQATDMNAVLNLGTRCGGPGYLSLAAKGGAVFATSGGNVGIGTSDIVCTNLTGALTIRKSYNGDTPNGATTQAYYSNQSALYLFGRNSGLSIISNNNEEGKIAFGNNCTTIYSSITTSTGNSSVGGDMYFKIGSDTERLRIFSTGITCFSCQVCVPQLVVCKTYNANNLMLSVANSTMSVPFVTYDTAIIQADDVTTLKLVERNGGASDNQILTLSVGDGSTRISTNGPNPLQLFVGGSSAGCGYNGLGGRNALSIACSGISTFNYPVYMGNISQYNNYSNSSGCFAVFYASQGAILFATSMHNGGRATYQLIYSNGATGGASISVVGSTGAYGPAATSFGLCANGWVYAYQQYGGPTDYYAINMNGSFSWAF